MYIYFSNNSIITIQVNDLPINQVKKNTNKPCQKKNIF